MSKYEHGIAGIGLTIPKYALPLEELAKIRQTSADNFLQNLGCQVMALCGPEDNVINMAVRAAERAIYHWGGNPEQIGMVVVATESAPDMSRPLSSWVMAALKLRGNIRSYEVKHACYGATAAIRQALEWRMAGAHQNKVALVVAADVAMYAHGHSGEPTQGAGAVALIIGEPKIAGIAPQSFYWSESNFDFWRPIGNLYPEVNGRLSLICYINAVLGCFKQVVPAAELAGFMQTQEYVAFHVPFPKMVQKAVRKLCDQVGLDAEQGAVWYQNKVFATMDWNQQIGNAYTASLWFAVARLLTLASTGSEFSAFSYGSGCGAELLLMQVVQNQATAAWADDLHADFAQRIMIDAHSYMHDFRRIPTSETNISSI